MLAYKKNLYYDKRIYVRSNIFTKYFISCDSYLFNKLVSHNLWSPNIAHSGE